MDLNFNRKERLKISKKFKIRGRTSKKNLNWRLINGDKKKVKELHLINEFEEKKQIKQSKIFLQHQAGPCHFSAISNELGNQKTWYSINVALPGSILNNCQTKELRAYVSGQLARVFAIFCVDEIIVFDETARLDEAQIETYYSGDWTGNEPINEKNSECNLYMARIFEYLECPQYLRKSLFPIHNSLQFAGLLNPLDAMHHLRSTDLHLPYREGIILDKPIKNKQRCDVGLNNEVLLDTTEWIPPYTRVTVKVDSFNNDSKKLKGILTSPSTIRNEAGIYWGFSVRIAKNLSDAVSGTYDFIIGTSEKGTSIENLSISRKENCKILLVFGGLAGLESAIEADQSISEKNPMDFFSNYINCLPDQGSRIIRTEEAIPICLSALKYKLNYTS